MISIQTLNVDGIEQAMMAMRNPLDSWAKGDTTSERVGEADRELTERLCLAGEEHAKHLRLCMVWADIIAPLYWWKEFDTYRLGVEKVSCSTMHTIHKRDFELSDFSHEHLDKYNLNLLDSIIRNLNGARKEFIDSGKTDKEAWWQLIQLLPSSYNQKRTVNMSYATLRRICKQRKGHKLDEWHEFIRWAMQLPESWMFVAERGDEK